MTDHELADHAERLHGLAAARTGTRDDLIRLRDIMPRVIERYRARLEIADSIDAAPLGSTEKCESLPGDLAATSL